MFKKSKDKLYLRGSTWWCWGYDAQGKRWRESTHQTDRRAAQLAAREIERKYALDSGAARASRITLGEALAQRRAAMQRHGRSEATIYAAHVHMRHLVHHIGADTPMIDITIATTTRYMEARLADKTVRASKHTVHKELVQLKAAWKRLAKLGELPPCPDLQPDELREVYTPGERFLSREEYARLLDALDRAPGSPGRPATLGRCDYVIVWVLSGVRRTELYDYQPGDYDAERRQWRVRGTKTDGADRVVPVIPEVHDVLVRHLETGFPEWGNYRRDLAAACERAKIAPVTCNDFRRTFATWMAEAGVPEHQTAKLMGHASTAMLRRVYSRMRTAGLVGAVMAISQRPPTEPSAEPAPPDKTLN